MKTPENCKNIEEIRKEIDNIDQEIINLIGKRFNYVKEIVKYKSPDKNSIIAKNRYNKVISDRKSWAEKQGLAPKVIEKIYKTLIDYFIKEEIEMVNNKNN